MDIENKIKGIGQELGLFQIRYFKEKANLDKRMDEANERIAVLETLVGNLQVRLEKNAGVEKKPEKIVEKIERERWYDFLMKK